MNDEKLNQLLRAARRETPPSAEPGFENLVLATLRNDSQRAEPETVSLFGQLGLLFPRLACVAVVIIALCVAADFGLTALAQTNLTDGVAELSEQWLFAVN